MTYRLLQGLYIVRVTTFVVLCLVYMQQRHSTQSKALALTAACLTKVFEFPFGDIFPVETLRNHDAYQGEICF